MHTAQAFGLALQDVLMVQSNSLHQLPQAVAARRHGEAEHSSGIGSVADATSSCEVTVLEVLVHTSALRQQFQLLAGLQTAITQDTKPGALLRSVQVLCCAASAHEQLAIRPHVRTSSRTGDACAGQNSMAILRSLHRALQLEQSDERTAVLRYLLLHAVRPLLVDVEGWLVGVEQQVLSRLST